MFLWLEDKKTRVLKIKGDFRLQEVKIEIITSKYQNAKGLVEYALSIMPKNDVNLATNYLYKTNIGVYLMRIQIQKMTLLKPDI